MNKCSQCGYERKPTDAGAQGTCPACGLVFANLIYREKKIAFAADAMGTLIMLLAMVWGGYILLQQYRNLESGD